MKKIRDAKRFKSFNCSFYFTGNKMCAKKTSFARQKSFSLSAEEIRCVFDDI